MAWAPGKLDFRPTYGSPWSETIRYLNSDRTPIVFDSDVTAQIKVRTLANRFSVDPDSVYTTIDCDIDPVTFQISWQLTSDLINTLNPTNTNVKYAYTLFLYGAQFGGNKPLVYGIIEITAADPP